MLNTKNDDTMKGLGYGPGSLLYERQLEIMKLGKDFVQYLKDNNIEVEELTKDEFNALLEEYKANQAASQANQANQQRIERRKQKIQRLKGRSTKIKVVNDIVELPGGANTTYKSKTIERVQEVKDGYPQKEDDSDIDQWPLYVENASFASVRGATYIDIYVRKRPKAAAKAYLRQLIPEIRIKEDNDLNLSAYKIGAKLKSPYLNASQMAQWEQRLFNAIKNGEFPRISFEGTPTPGAFNYYVVSDESLEKAKSYLKARLRYVEFGIPGQSTPVPTGQTISPQQANVTTDAPVSASEAGIIPGVSNQRLVLFAGGSLIAFVLLGAANNLAKPKPKPKPKLQKAPEKTDATSNTSIGNIKKIELK